MPKSINQLVASPAARAAVPGQVSAYTPLAATTASCAHTSQWGRRRAAACHTSSPARHTPAATMTCSILAAYSISKSEPAALHQGMLSPRKARASGCAAARAAVSGQTNTSVVHTQPALDSCAQS